jgi:hypothetical protein
MSAVHYNSFTDARSHFRDLLDAAQRGHVASVRRDDERVAIVDAERLRHFLGALVPRAQVVPEAGGWSIFIPGLPLAADGSTLNEAVDEMVIALRDYADDWHDHLSKAANHADNWGLVQLISFSDDTQLRTWLGAPEATATAA